MESASPGTRYFPDIGWVAVGKGVELPYITRPPDVKFIPVKLIDRLILRHYPSTYPKELADKPPLICQFLNADEANILSGLCEHRYQTSHLVGTHDPIVNLLEFQVFFNIVQETYPDVQIAVSAANEPQTPTGAPSTKKRKKSWTAHVPHGWMLIKDAMIPFVERGAFFLLPLNVLQGAAQLLTNVSVDMIPSLPAEVDCLNRLCKTAKMTFIFEKNTALVDLTTIMMHNPNCPVRPLPSDDPLSGLVPGPDSINAISTSECVMIPPALAAMYNLPPPPPLVPLDKVFPNYNMNTSPTVTNKEVLTPSLPETGLAPSTNSGLDRACTTQPNLDDSKPIEHIAELQDKFLVQNKLPPPINSHAGSNFKPLPEPVKILPIECFGKTISCITRGKLKTKYALVEAVCRVFFTECNLVDFVNYLEHDLSVKLHSLKKAEEATFINFFEIPTDKLCCNLLIKLKDFVDRMAWLKEQFGDAVEMDAVVPCGIQETRNDSVAAFPKKRKASNSLESGTGEGPTPDPSHSELDQLRLAIQKLKNDQQQQQLQQQQQPQQQQQHQQQGQRIEPHMIPPPCSHMLAIN